jgi:flagellar biosynthesis protein FlhA
VRHDAAVATALLGMLALTVVPLPPFLVDLLLGVALCLAVVIFLVALYVERPLEFSAFPSLLLFVTLFRLALNIATTRLILTRGGSGEAAAGAVIEGLGRLATGGNYVVGGVVFLLLVTVNFIVITKGSERISEVAARFTLDALPGKQMAIDAELAARLIDEDEARQRRRALQREAEFHGAMDGASRFVRGDAVAGLLITALNIAGGMVIGMAQNGMSPAQAAATYTVLSIGDGLITQIPALLVSTGAALLVTRSGDGALGPALGGQLLSHRGPLLAAACVLGGLALLPGMPHLLFAGLAVALGHAARRAGRPRRPPRPAGTVAEVGPPPPGPGERQALAAALPVDLLALEVGVDLLPLVDAGRGGELLGRIAAVRQQLASELGILVPPVRIADNLRLRPGGYRIAISGVPVAEGQLRVGRLLALDPAGSAGAAFAGEIVIEPTYGLPARWIVPADRARAEAVGCPVVDAPSVLATHLAEVIRRHAAELLGRREAQELLDIAARSDARVVAELIPGLLPLGEVIKVLRNLLQEGVSIRDLRTILEALADHAGTVKDPGELTEYVRQRLGRRITRASASETGELAAMVLAPATEDLFRGSGEPRLLARLTAELAAEVRRATQRDETPVLVVAPDVRRAVATTARRHLPGLVVMSHREVDPAVRLVTRRVFSVEEIAA